MSLVCSTLINYSESCFVNIYSKRCRLCVKCPFLKTSSPSLHSHKHNFCNCPLERVLQRQARSVGHESRTKGRYLCAVFAASLQQLRIHTHTHTHSSCCVSTFSPAQFSSAGNNKEPNTSSESLNHLNLRGSLWPRLSCCSAAAGTDRSLINNSRETVEMSVNVCRTGVDVFKRLVCPKIKLQLLREKQEVTSVDELISRLQRDHTEVLCADRIQFVSRFSLNLKRVQRNQVKLQVRGRQVFYWIWTGNRLLCPLMCLQLSVSVGLMCVWGHVNVMETTFLHRHWN